MGLTLECDGCGQNVWTKDTDWYPFYCDTCKSRGPITQDELLDVVEKLNKLKSIKVIG